MDDFEKQFTSSLSILPSAVPKFSQPDAGVTNENDVIHDQMASKLKNPKKPLSTKHFMSPTISAASKATVPRKKILAERNETLDVEQTHLTKSFNFDSGKPSLCSSESDDDLQNKFTGDSSFPPYDPIRNYLSPRPQFLRYNPNRRHKIFVRPKNESGEKKYGVGGQEGSSFDLEKPSAEEELGAKAGTSGSSTQQEQVAVVDEKIDKGEDEDDGEEEFEEFEEVRGWDLKGVLKFLFVMIAVILSTIYISSMNSPTASPTLEAVRGFKDGYYNKTQNSVFRAVGINFSEVRSEPVDPRVEIDYGLEEEDIVVDDNMEFVDAHDQTEEVCEDEMENMEESSDQLQEPETSEILHGHQLESEKEMFDKKLEKADEGSDELQGSEIAQIQKHELERAMEICGYEMKKAEEGSDELQGTETAEKSENEKEFELNSEDDMEISFEILEDDVEEKGEVISENAVDESDSEDIGSVSLTPETNSLGPLVKLAKTDLILIAAVGVSILLTIFTSLGFIYYSRQKKISSRDPPPAERISPLILKTTEKEKIQKAEPSMNPSALVQPKEEGVSRQISHTHAPTVELLGELVFGEVSSSLRSCGMKRNMLEAEESNFSFSRGVVSSWVKRSNLELSMADSPSLDNEAGVVSRRAKTANLELPVEDSPSYGSFTAEKKIVKKERDRDSDVSIAVASPVRRSSRIRNRSVMSP